MIYVICKSRILQLNINWIVMATVFKKSLVLDFLDLILLVFTTLFSATPQKKKHLLNIKNTMKLNFSRQEDNFKGSICVARTIFLRTLRCPKFLARIQFARTLCCPNAVLPERCVARTLRCPNAALPEWRKNN